MSQLNAVQMCIVNNIESKKVRKEFKAAFKNHNRLKEKLCLLTQLNKAIKKLKSKK
jgi:DNA polymerase elongation subunit (family B)